VDTRTKPRKPRFLQAIREFIEGAIMREPAMVALQERAHLERLLFVVAFGDYLGIPMPRSYYSLRLLPYLVPGMDPCRRGMLRERDWTDRAFD
jgi:hypothetical protein